MTMQSISANKANAHGFAQSLRSFALRWLATLGTQVTHEKWTPKLQAKIRCPNNQEYEE